MADRSIREFADEPGAPAAGWLRLGLSCGRECNRESQDARVTGPEDTFPGVGRPRITSIVCVSAGGYSSRSRPNLYGADQHGARFLGVRNFDWALGSS
jgi:hypothetical protein